MQAVSDTLAKLLRKLKECTHSNLFELLRWCVKKCQTQRQHIETTGYPNAHMDQSSALKKYEPMASHRGPKWSKKCYTNTVTTTSFLARCKLYVIFATYPYVNYIVPRSVLNSYLVTTERLVYSDKSTIKDTVETYSSTKLYITQNAYNIMCKFSIPCINLFCRLLELFLHL